MHNRDNGIIKQQEVHGSDSSDSRKDGGNILQQRNIYLRENVQENLCASGY